jgi:hypothetical protein
MTYRTVEVDLENGRVQSRTAESLPTRSRALLTLLDSITTSTALTCDELAKRWPQLEKLPVEEAFDFADDIETAHAKMLPPKRAWD